MVFNNATRLLQRIRISMSAVNSEIIILIKGACKRLFEFGDGSLDTGMHGLIGRWSWDAQGMTDAIVTPVSRAVRLA